MTTKNYKSMSYKFCFCIIVSFGMISWIVGYCWSEKSIHENVEKLEYFIKKGSIHTIQNELLQEGINLPPVNDTKIFFLHMPRTTGDSIRTDLFGVSKEWLLDYSGWKSYEMPFNIGWFGGDKVYNVLQLPNDTNLSRLKTRSIGCLKMVNIFFV